VNPATLNDILWSWSHNFLTTSAAIAMLNLTDRQSLLKVALQNGVPEPSEEAISPEEAAATLGDEPVEGDVSFHVRQRIRDARLTSYRRSDVEARNLFEERYRKR
jgi:hypothetical protein